MQSDEATQSSESADLERRIRDELKPGLELLHPLGHGTMASVFLARETALRRLVALKVLSPALARDPTARLRFEREGQAVASIVHPNVVAVYRVDRLSDETPFLVMQYVKGTSLEERVLARGRLAPGEVRHVLADVAAALAAAHQRGVIHRDLRAANILWEEETGRVLLTDFGLAYLLTTGRDESLRLTLMGVVVGDASRISPEQRSGRAVTDRADVYSLGVLGFELLTGVRPGLTDAAAGEAPVRAGATRDLTDLRPDLDGDLADLLERCLADTATHRPPAAEIARRLSEPAARSTSGASVHGEPVRRLAAILFADIVGYSPLSGTNERAALALVNVLQSVSRDHVEEFNGRVVKYVGDAVLARFNSTDAAVQAALLMLSDFAAAAAAQGISASLRIGVHVGEVTTAPDGDLYGDGVNIAARLQSAATAGQLLVSGEVWRQLQSRPEYAFRVLGERALKGIASPVRLVEVSRTGAHPTPVPRRSQVVAALASRRARAWIWIALALLLAAVLLLQLT